MSQITDASDRIAALGFASKTEKKKKLTIYLAGAINGCTDEEANGWRNKLTELWGAERVRNPMVRDYRDAKMTAAIAEEIVYGDLNDIALCDAVVAYIEKPSFGTAQELVYAWHMGKRVIVIYKMPPKSLSPWVLFHSHLVCDSIEKAIDALRA